jgi:hypothetical protein
MIDTVTNLTDSSRDSNPIDGDFMLYTSSNGSTRKQHYYTPIYPSGSELQELKILEVRSWRDSALASTDYIVPLTDHPNHAATLAYRALLRDWPSTSDFPDTKPTL